MFIEALPVHVRLVLCTIQKSRSIAALDVIALAGTFKFAYDESGSKQEGFNLAYEKLTQLGNSESFNLQVIEEYLNELLETIEQSQ